MNIAFKIIPEEDSIVVSNEKGFLETIPYRDNHQNIFILNNVIESLEKEKEDLIQRKNDLKSRIKDFEELFECRKKENIWYTIDSLSIFPVAPIIITYFGAKWYGNPLMNTIFGTIGRTHFYGGMFTGAIALAIDAILISAIWRLRKRDHSKEEYTDCQKKFQGLEEEISMLEEIISLKKQDLEILENVVEKENKDIAIRKVQFVNYREHLEKERKKLTMMYNYGYKKEEYLALCQTDETKLWQALIDEYTLDDAEFLYEQILCRKKIS